MIPTPSTEDLENLTIACFQGNHAVIEAFVDRFTKDGLNTITQKGTSIRGGDLPITGAVSANRIDTIAFLLEKGADINARNEYGETPLVFALHRRCPIRMITYLLEAGADPEAKSNRGETALSGARRNNHREAIPLLEDAIKAYAIKKHEQAETAQQTDILKQAKHAAPPKITLKRKTP